LDFLFGRVAGQLMTTPEDIGKEIDSIRKSLVLLLEYPDQKFSAYAAAQKALDLASTTLSDYRTMGVDQKLAMRFAHDALGRAHAALQSSGEDEPALSKIESCMAQLAEGTV
jgi:hypothetical protein